jgi:hypothetical protein
VQPTAISTRLMTFVEVFECAAGQGVVENETGTGAIRNDST